MTSGVNDMLCSTCDRELTGLTGRHSIPSIGTVCRGCSERLEKPTLLDGCVEGPPVAELARAKYEEYVHSRVRLVEQARTVCQRDVQSGE